jgi:hypothetical protein
MILSPLALAREICRLRDIVLDFHAKGGHQSGPDFTDIETYGLERWLGELALALRQETYRPETRRRLHVPRPPHPPIGADAKPKS